MGKISNILHLIKKGLVADIPSEYQACESCREIDCTSERFNSCPNRLLGERQETIRREESKTK